jgi:hypothetical protein
MRIHLTKLFVILGLLAAMAGTTMAQDPFGPRITATRWVLAHGRDSSVRLPGILNPANPRGQPVPGATAVINIIGQFPNPQAITLSVNQAGSQYERRGTVFGGPTGRAVVRDPGTPPLAEQLIRAGANLSSGVTLAVVELPPSGTGFIGWEHLTSRFGAGNLYASVSIPGTSIVAGMELVTYEQLKQYTANSIFYEAPCFGNVVVGHGLSGGTSWLRAKTTNRQNPTVGRSFGWANPLQMQLSLVRAQRQPDGRVWIDLAADLPNSFEDLLMIRWAAAWGKGTVMGDTPVVATRIPGKLARRATFRIVVPKDADGMVSIQAVASPRLPILRGGAPAGANPFIERLSANSGPGLSTFHSRRSTLEDTLSVTVPPATSGPGPDPTPTADGYTVFILTNVSGGSIWIGRESELKKTHTYDFSGGGLKDGDGSKQLIKYVKKSQEFKTFNDAKQFYLKSLQSQPRSIPLTGGSKAKIFGGDYWVDTVH